MKLVHGCALALLLGCSSSSSSTAPADTGSSTDSGETPVPDASCVRPGDKGNDKGVGTPCTPLGKECEPFASSAPVCLADVGQDQWMCTRIGCKVDSECGKDATCYKDKDGSACVPNRCLDKPADGGTDATGDGATTDGSADASDASEAG